MYHFVHDFLYTVDIHDSLNQDSEILQCAENLAQKAFSEKDTKSLLDAQRTLYEINLAYLSIPWKKAAVNIAHPLVAGIKYCLEKHWERSEQSKYDVVLKDLPPVEMFPQWVNKYVASHHSNELHPIFTYLRDEASLPQMQAFFLQETPLEMLFGDIVALMLPGVYGAIKVEFVKNYWDEVGHAVDEKVHRNMRADLMKFLHISADSYITDASSLVVEELELINMYLSLATNRAKLTELIGTMLATELMIPGRFEYQIEGWRRLGISDGLLAYHLEHVTVDAEHAQDWLHKVVMPILHHDPSAMIDIVRGVSRRLDTAARVSDRLYTHIRDLEPQKKVA